MPKNLKGLSLLIAAMLFLLACGKANGNSGSTNPVTPTSSPVMATQTLPGKTEMPTITPDPAATPQTATFSPLEIKIVDLSEAAVIIDETGWPTTALMPQQGYTLVALRCDGGIELGFVETDQETQLDIEVNCADSAELLIIAPVEAGPILLIGVGETVAESHTEESGFFIDRWIFKSGSGDRLVDWSSET